LKRLAMFLDGTWNDPDDNTNVWRSQLLVCDTDADGNAQDRYYEEGVGTKRFERIRGGALGEGLDANLRHAYEWLMSRYEDGDKIYLWGFSRGAYTARSLGGLIGRCGLLLPGSPFSIQQVFERHRRGADDPSLLDLQFRRRPRELWSREDEWLMEYFAACRYRLHWARSGCHEEACRMVAFSEREHRRFRLRALALRPQVPVGCANPSVTLLVRIRG
jgi:T6SS, Phospholipase effector Tle1-like, catalytic domain